MGSEWDLNEIGMSLGESNTFQTIIHNNEQRIKIITIFTFSNSIIHYVGHW